MRRFYRQAAVAAGAPGYQVLLDGKQLRPPATAELILPTRALAEAIAAEWNSQGEKIEPRGMAFMRLAATAIDRVRPLRPQVIAEIAAYAGTDLLCYRAAGPAELIDRQERTWQPLLDWLHQRYDAHLQVTRCVVAVPQSERSLKALEAAVAAEDDLTLAGLQALTASLGSLVLALAVRAVRLDIGAAFRASQLDEDYQAERWGLDSEAAAAREALWRDLQAVGRYLDLLRPPDGV